jgi:hypothetical protein
MLFLPIILQVLTILTNFEKQWNSGDFLDEYWSRNHWRKQLISNFSENFRKRKKKPWPIIIGEKL